MPDLTWRAYTKDWAVVAVLLVAFFTFFEKTQPFYRQFKLSDPRLQHPFAHSERVTDVQLYLISTLIPMGTMAVTKAARKSMKIQIGNLHLTILGLWISLTVAACVTDVLKDWIGNPRPDFLERCGAAVGTPFDVYVNVDVCTSPLGINRLADGMKSTPLGHSSIAFAGLFYLYLWLGRSWALVGMTRWLRSTLRLLPILLGAYIAFSRTQDYRHHFGDVFLGLFLGIAAAYGLFKKYHEEI